MGYILAFDVGTTAVKAVLINRITGELWSAQVNCLLMQPRTGWAEQDANQLWDTVCQASRNCVVKASVDCKQIEGIAMAAPWKHVIPLDAEFHPIRNSIIWMDSRAIQQSTELNSRMGCFVESAQGYWPRLMWLKENEPEIWAKAEYIAGINDYFKYRATGHLTTECSDNFIFSTDAAKQAHYDKVLHAAGLDEDLRKFPPNKKCTDCVGYLTQQAAAEMGLCAGIPVFGGFGDLSAIYLGSGSLNPGVAHIYLGTSSWFGELMTERPEGYARLYFAATEDYHGAHFGLTTGGRAYDWIIDRFYKEEKNAMGNNVFSQIDDEISQISPGCDGLLVTHWLNGEAAPLSKNAKAVFFNVTEQHDRRHFARAMLESICYSHRRALEKYIAYHGEPPKRLNIVGGGALSNVWMQMMADVLKIPVCVPSNPRYAGTLGVYYCVLIGLGIESDFSKLRAPEGDRTFWPQHKNESIYDKMFEVYQGLHPALKPLYDTVNGVY